MTPAQIIFLITAIVTLGSALMVITTRNMVHAALWLILSLLGVSVTFVLLQAGFLAVVQVVIYIGAIAILMIFAIMLTRGIGGKREAQINRGWPWALLISLATFAGLAWMLNSWDGLAIQILPLDSRVDTISQLGQALVSPYHYLIPFEVASVMLLAALIGAIIIAWDRK